MRVLGAGLLAFSVVAAACGGGVATTAGGRTIEIQMKEFAYGPAAVTLKAGETVTFLIKNNGAVEHEFMAGRHATSGSGYRDDWLEMARVGETAEHGMGHQGSGVRVQPKQSARLTVTVPAETGEFEFGCFLTGHYEAGMKGTLAVR